MYNWWLVMAGTCSAFASLAHIFCIWGGAPWYRFFGAGEKIVRMAEQGAIAPTLITLSIAAVLAFWSIYAFSGAGIIPPLPFLHSGLLVITAVYLIRAAALPVMMKFMTDRSTTFLVTSSVIVLLIGLIHGVGLYGEIQAPHAGGGSPDFTRDQSAIPGIGNKAYSMKRG